MASHLLEKMNPQQQDGIQSVDGPVLLLAGAGSGKTRVITHRIAYLIQERGVPADSILAVTFTNKAAKEMAERVDKIMGHTSLAKPTLATFHSFCVRVLRRDIEALRTNGVGLTKSFAIYDETDQQAVVKQALKRLAIDDKQLKPRVALGRISWGKEPHDRSAGVLSCFDKPDGREDRAYLRDLPEGVIQGERFGLR